MRTRLLLILILLTSVSAAGVYRWQDADGVIQYSDRPVEHAEELNISGAEDDSTGDSTGEQKDALDPATNGTYGEDHPTDAYTEFHLAEPEENQTLRTDAGEVNIALLLKPALAQGHEIQLVVDGRPLENRFSSTQLMLSAVGRGSHTLQAKIVDAQGETYASTQVVNFHIRKGLLSGDQSEVPQNN